MNYKELKEKLNQSEEIIENYDKRTKNLNSTIETLMLESVKLTALCEKNEDEKLELTTQLKEFSSKEHSYVQNIEKLRGENVDYKLQIKNLETINRQLLREKDELKNFVDQYEHILKELTQKHIIQTEQIIELLKEQKSLQEQMEKSRKNSTILKAKAEPKSYIKGMFNTFIFEKNALSILINNKEYFYPLNDYECSYLPMSGSRVMMFKTQSGKNKIFGFDESKMIEPVNTIKAEVKSFQISQSTMRLLTKEYGYIEVKIDEEFFRWCKIISVNSKSTMIIKNKKDHRDGIKREKIRVRFRRVDAVTCWR